MRRSLVITALAMVSGLVSGVAAQDPGQAVTDFDKKRGGSAKMKRLAHVPAHDGAWKAADVELEQEPNRPYAYLSGFVNYDVTIYDIRNTAAPKQIYRWSIENPELHRGIGAMDGKYFKINGRYYLFNIASPGSRWARTVIVHRADGKKRRSRFRSVAPIEMRMSVEDHQSAHQHDEDGQRIHPMPDARGQSMAPDQRGGGLTYAGQVIRCP